MGKFIDLTGKVFGRWTVIKKIGMYKNDTMYWECQCSCEAKTIKVIAGKGLKRGGSTSCGCYQKERMSKVHFKDLTGQTFNQLYVIEYSGQNKQGMSLWKCQCDCNGPNSIKTIIGASLINGNTKSCGCYKLDMHYRGTKDISGQFFSSLVRGAKNRGIDCNIKIEEIQELLEKQDYQSSLSGVNICGSRSSNKKHNSYLEQTASLDRIDSSKGYTIDNVQWVHKDENFAKHSLDEDEFIQMCGRVWNHKKTSRIVKCYRYEKTTV